MVASSLGFSTSVPSSAFWGWIYRIGRSNALTSACIGTGCPPLKKAAHITDPGFADVRDSRLSGFDAAVLMEVIEHMDFDRLAAFERVVFEFARPAHVVVTTPNVEYNTKFESIAPRASSVTEITASMDSTRVPSLVRGGTASASDTESGSCRLARRSSAVGPPTQMAVFSRDGEV